MSATRTTPFAIVLVTLGALTVAYSLFASGDSDTRGYLVVAAIVIATAAVVFGPVASRAEADPVRARKTAWWLAGLSVVTLPVFWLGIPAILGGAAVQVGSSGARRAGGGARRARDGDGTGGDAVRLSAA